MELPVKNAHQKIEEAKQILTEMHIEASSHETHEALRHLTYAKAYLDKEVGKHPVSQPMEGYEGVAEAFATGSTEGEVVAETVPQVAE